MFYKQPRLSSRPQFVSSIQLNSYEERYQSRVILEIRERRKQRENKRLEREETENRKLKINLSSERKSADRDYKILKPHIRSHKNKKKLRK